MKQGLYDGYKVTAKCGNCGAIAYYEGTQFVRGVDGKTAVKAGCVQCYALDLAPYRALYTPFKKWKVKVRKPKPKKVEPKSWSEVDQEVATEGLRARRQVEAIKALITKLHAEGNERAGYCATGLMDYHHSHAWASDCSACIRRGNKRDMAILLKAELEKII